ncbi:MAG TPA: homoserine kinase [Baekduia sp.]|nr:homoserine kinase [Baekduia sp.]
MDEAVAVRVPASSANLGPGFDSFAAALSLNLDVEVVRTGSFAVVTELDVAKDATNLVARAFGAIADPAQYEFRIESQIPLSGGLGSSAAAVVAGLMAAAQFTGGDHDLLALATEIEGHPDNAAAALHGGFVICTDDGVVQLTVPGGLGAVLVIPHDAVVTEQARAALPATVPMADAVHNLANAAALALAIERGDLELLATSLGDRLHQPPRAALYPRTAELVEQARSFGALGATVSGAGPSVLMWCESDAAAEAEARLAHATRGWAAVRRVDFAAEGASFR